MQQMTLRILQLDIGMNMPCKGYHCMKHSRQVMLILVAMQECKPNLTMTRGCSKMYITECGQSYLPCVLQLDCSTC